MIKRECIYMRINLSKFLNEKGYNVNDVNVKRVSIELEGGRTVEVKTISCMETEIKNNKVFILIGKIKGKV